MPQEVQSDAPFISVHRRRMISHVLTVAARADATPAVQDVKLVLRCPPKKGGELTRKVAGNDGRKPQFFANIRLLSARTLFILLR